MSAPSVLTQFANPDPNAAPINLTQLIQLLNSLVSSNIQGTYIPYVISADAPGADDRDKAWIKLDSGGRPLGTFIYYSGNWRRIYNGMPGQIQMYAGNPSTDFDSTGLGIVGGNYDGWALCNGNNSTPDLSNRFIIAGDIANLSIGYSGGQWKTNVEGTAQANGGNAQVTLDSAHTYNPVGNLVLGRWKIGSGGETNDASGLLFGQPSTFNETLAIGPNNTSPTPIDIVNPYIALGFVLFVGYA